MSHFQQQCVAVRFPAEPPETSFLSSGSWAGGLRGATRNESFYPDSWTRDGNASSPPGDQRREKQRSTENPKGVERRYWPESVQPYAHHHLEETNINAAVKIIMNGNSVTLMCGCEAIKGEQGLI